jgi:hypothetical protein
MGLDAFVYRNKENLPFDADALGASFDATTGEYYFEDPQLDKKFSLEMRTAIEKRIGNIDLVAHLRHLAQQILDENSVVLSRVLYSGSHTGDSLDAQFFPSLENELSLLRNATRSSHDMKLFVDDMCELVTAAKKEGNPIVF